MHDITIWQYPLSVILALTFLAGTFALWRYLPNGRLRCIIKGRGLCITSLTAITLMTAIEGSWGTRLHATPLFWCFALMLILSLQFTVFDALKHKKSYSFIASHLGILLLCMGAFWSAPDKEEGVMIVNTEATDDIAYTNDHKLLKLPFAIRLTDFRTEYYADGVSPKQYTSHLLIDGKHLETSVNHPCYHDGYFIYQYDFDHVNGRYSVLKLVKDPWLPMVYTGIMLLAIGALLQLRLNWRSRYLTIAIVLLSILFTGISIARINFGTLMPALRSLWFVPHLAFYMIAYSSLALSLTLAVLSAFNIKSRTFDELSHKLFTTSSSLLLLGMICGAIWAKAAWGDWWTWDAKECWAAVTWLITLMGIHLPHGIRHGKAAIIICIALSFAAMQIAWYGVDHLPAARSSMHTYK